MKKQITSFLLAVIMAITLIPVRTLANDTSMTGCDIVDTIVLNEGSKYPLKSLADSSGMAQAFNYLTPTSGVTVLIFFRAENCTNSQYVFRSIAQSKWISNSQIRIIAIESSGASKEETQAFMDTYVGNKAVNFNTYYGNQSLQFAYSRLVYGSNSVAWPFVLLITNSQSRNHIRYTAMGMNDASIYGNSLSTLIGNVDASDTVTVNVAGTQYYDYAYEVFETVNRERQNAGVSSLSLNKTLTDYAMQRAAEIALYYDHIRPNGSASESIFDSAYQPDGWVGENIAYTTGANSAIQVMNLWMNSSGHKANILSRNYSQIGVGCFENNNVMYYVQIFGGSSSNTGISTQRGRVSKNVPVSTLTSHLSLQVTPMTSSVTLGMNEAETFYLKSYNSESGFDTALAPLVGDVKDENNPSLTIATASVSKDGTGAVTVTPRAEGVGTLYLHAYQGESNPKAIKLHVVGSAGSTSGKCGDNLTWNFDALTGTLTIRGAGAMYDYKGYPEVPSTTYEGCAPWACFNDQIKKVVVEKGVTYIGKFAFGSGSGQAYSPYEWCIPYGTSITLPDTLRTIGVSAFGGFGFYNKGAAISIVIPNGVTTICEGAFHECEYVVAVTLPTSVTKIEKYAFDVNTIDGNEIKDVYYGGTQEQWNRIDIETSGTYSWEDPCNQPLINANIHFSGTSYFKYSVKYNLNGGTGSQPDNVGYNAGDTVTVFPGGIPTREGYTFAGWSDGTNTYSSGQTFVMPEHDVTLTAIWKAVPTDVIQKYIDFACSYNGMNRTQIDINGEWSKGGWCASFITWCAGKVGLGQIIPNEPSSKNLFQILIEEYGATGVYFGKYKNSTSVARARILNNRKDWTPQPGDLIFLDWTNSGNNSADAPFDHVGLVTGYNSANDAVYIVSGNAGDGKVQWQNGKAPYWTIPNASIAGYVRPNYENYAKPIAGTISATFKCPVDVVIAYNQETLDSETKQLRASFGTMTLNADDSISVTLEYGVPYDISITGNGSGTMSMDVLYNLDSGTSGQHFVDVPISTATEISVITNRADTTLLVSENKQLVETWYASNGETATKKDTGLFDELTTADIEPNDWHNPFTDVPANAYYADAVAWAVENNITQGTSATTFEPNANCTRSQIVTFLWRANGEPEPTTTKNPFTDVKSSDFYYKAVLWAVEEGITQGTSATMFSPNEPCTRSQAVTFLWRAEDRPIVSGSTKFTDVPAGQWYSDAVSWAVAKGVTQGTSTTTFEPNTICSRAQIVTFLYRDMAG